MNLNDIETKCFILALFIRDDGERLLLGSGDYEFSEKLQHFKANTFQKDVVELQGTDGQLLAGQVRRTVAQPFDGFVGDATVSQTSIEDKRRAFLMFFRKKHFYTVVYIFPDGSAIQRQRGYIVDAPSVQEMFQKFPEYHVALNFEDPNYYEYAEDELGDEIYAHIEQINLALALSGGLVWDNNGAVSLPLSWDGTTVSGSGTGITLLNAVDAPFKSIQANGNTTQQTSTGKNKMPMAVSDNINTRQNTFNISLPTGTYTASYDLSDITLGTNTTFSPYMKLADANNGNAKDFSLKTIDSSTTAGHYNITFSLTTPASVSGTSDIRIPQTQWNNGARCKLSNIQIESGSTATTFEKYTGGVPAPNPDFPSPVETVAGRQPVSITGKNLLGLDAYPPTPNNATLTHGVNDLKLVAISTTGAQYARVQIDLDSSTTYTLSGIAKKIVKGTDGRPWLAVRWRGSNNNGLTWTAFNDLFFNQNPTQGTSYSFSGHFTGYKRYQILFYNNYYTPVSVGETTEYSQLQLEVGSTATAFEPYQGQSYKINLGKNLFDKSQNPSLSIGVATTQTQTGVKVEVNSSGSWRNAVWIIGRSEAFLNKGITLSTVITQNSYGESTVGIGLCDENGGSRQLKASSNLGGSISITYNHTTEDASRPYIYIALYGATNTSAIGAYAVYDDVQVEAGTASTPFAPYFTPIELCKIGNYQDYIWNDGGTWKIHKAINKVVLDGSDDETWTVQNSGTANYFYVFSSIPQYAVAASAVSNYFTRVNISGSDTNVGFTPINNTTIRFRPNFAEISLADWKTWLASHTTVVYHSLATPTDTAITEPTLLAQLETIKTAGTRDGLTNIMVFTDSSNLPTPLSVVAYTGGAISDSGYVWEDGGGGGINTVSVVGIDDARPVWTVDGPATNPTLTNITTGQTITWTGTVPTGQQLIVDMDNMTASLAGANVFEFISGEWITLKSGNNGISYNATGTNDQPSTLSWNGVVG